jgi:signal transduction histidine kinase
MQPTSEQRNIEFEIILKDTNLSLQVDTSLIEQVLINIILNAIEALKDTIQPKVILLAEESENNKVLIKIADNGIGIPSEQMDKIFIPFFTSRKNGTGIGLSLCKQIMTMHKGVIRVQSTEGKGTIFTLQFN